MIQTFEAENINMPLVDYAFEILKKVDQGAFTKWSIVYDIDNRMIYFDTDSGKRRSLAFNQFSFSCNSIPRSYDLTNKHEGNVGRQFIPFSASLNEKLLKQAFHESRSQFRIPAELQDQIANQPQNFSCAD